jgi:TfoX/Sxy family transcriptional regulator of competence genes
MAYDEELQLRIQRVVAGREGVTEKRMFGGVAFLLDGKMFCGIVKDDLMVRVGPLAHEAALAEPHVRPMDFTGKPMAGYVYVEPEGLATDKALRRWVEAGLKFAATVEKKAKKKRAAK